MTKTKLESKIREILGYQKFRTYYRNLGGFKKKVVAPLNSYGKVDKLLALFEAELKKERVKVIEEIEKWLISEELPIVTQEVKEEMGLIQGRYAGEAHNQALLKTRQKLNELKGEGKHVRK
jgi:hypothetical protein